MVMSLHMRTIDGIEFTMTDVDNDDSSSGWSACYECFCRTIR